MSAPSIPVDLRNPGQVFACLGFLEAADVLLGDAEGGFDWSDEGNVSFALRAGGERNPFEVVLEFLAEAEPKRWGPKGYADPPPKKGKGDTDADDEPDEDAAADLRRPAIWIWISPRPSPPRKATVWLCRSGSGAETGRSSSLDTGLTDRAGRASSSTLAIGQRTRSRERC